jgi:hypothetical protein
VKYSILDPLSTLGTVLTPEGYPSTPQAMSDSYMIFDCDSILDLNTMQFNLITYYDRYDIAGSNVVAVLNDNIVIFKRPIYKQYSKMYIFACNYTDSAFQSCTRQVSAGNYSIDYDYVYVVDQITNHLHVMTYNGGMDQYTYHGKYNAVLNRTGVSFTLNTAHFCDYFEIGIIADQVNAIYASWDDTNNMFGYFYLCSTDTGACSVTNLSSGQIITITSPNDPVSWPPVSTMPSLTSTTMVPDSAISLEATCSESKCNKSAKNESGSNIISVSNFAIQISATVLLLTCYLYLLVQFSCKLIVNALFSLNICLIIKNKLLLKNLLILK